ncbi:pyridoxamine 5'-phosphate oxidase family protein [Plantactinospora sp. DSM 117369]
MARWREIEQDAPDFAARVRERFSAGTNKTIATLRRDGSPRISASELEFGDGEATLGMMGGSMKLLDVRRDPRIAVHSPTIEPPADAPESWPGDAKLAGRVVAIPPPVNTPHAGAGFFRIDITELVLTYVGTPADHLVIESWHPGTGWRRRTRD